MKIDRKLTFLFISLVLFVSFFLSGCGDRGVVASVGKTKITLGEFKERISNLPKRYQIVVRKRKREYLEELINDTLLYQEALKNKLDRDKDALKVIEEAKKKILIAKLLNDKVDGAIDITDEEVTDYYNKNNEKFMSPELMRVSHILTPTRKEAEELLARIKKGDEFGQVAREKSVDPTAQNGGDIGYFPKGQLIPEFEFACSTLKVGEVSDVVMTKLGYHLIKLTDRKEPQLLPLEKVRDRIKQVIKAMERQRLFNELLAKVREKNKVKVNENLLSKFGEESAEEKLEESK